MPLAVVDLPAREGDTTMRIKALAIIGAVLMAISIVVGWPYWITQGLAIVALVSLIIVRMEK